MGKKIVTYGVFWEPPIDIQEYIDEWKSKIKDIEPDAQYLNHIVHSTFYLININLQDSNLILNTFNTLIKSIEPINIVFKGWKVFYNDLSTNADTLIYEILNNDKLVDAQQVITNKLIQFKQKDIDYISEWSGDYLLSKNKWGFPFVGKHWIPHLTVASVNKKCTQIINDALASNHILPSVELNKLSLFSIDEKGNHERIKTIELE